MTTVRERIEDAMLEISLGQTDAALHDLIAAIKGLDESATAWRADGSTYRLVVDTIEKEDS